MSKPQSKGTLLTMMIRRKSRAIIQALQSQLNWQPHTIRAEISRLRQTGLIVTHSTSAKCSVYKAQEVPLAIEAD